MGTMNAVILTFGVSQKTYMDLSHWKRTVLSYHTAQGTRLSVAWQPGEEGSLGWMDTWQSPFMFTWNYHNIVNWLCCCSVTKLGQTLRLHVLQCTRLSRPSLSPEVCSSSCPLSPWCNPTISACAAPFSSCLPSIRVFSNELALHIRWPKYWSFSFNISPSSEYSGLIFFRINRLDHLAVQGTLKGLLQHHILKASVLQCSAFFMVQLSHSYMTTGKTIALPSQTFAGKVMSLLFNTLSRFVIAFLPRTKHLSISWLQSLSAVDFWAQENKTYDCFHFSPFYLPWSDGLRCHDLHFLNVEF